MKKNLSLLLTGALALTLAGKSYGASGETALDNPKEGLSFTENLGQVRNQHDQKNSSVLFSGKTDNLVFHLKNNGISYQLYKNNNKNKGVSIHRLDVEWLNANLNHAIHKGAALDGVSNYYYNGKAISNIKSYADVTYSELYKGIDLKWYDSMGSLEYDFIVQPGADYKQIQMSIKGADNINVTENGDLSYETSFGKVIEKAPVVTQNGKLLKSAWKVKNKIVSFNIENVDPSQKMIIDPVIRTWGTYYGSGSFDQFQATTADNLGNIYCVGRTNCPTSTIIATVGSHQAAYAGGGDDAMIAKFNSNGTRLWSSYFGGTGSDQANGCTVDASGNVYVCGRTASTNSAAIATAGAHQTTFGGATYDGFLAKFNSSGVIQWGTYYGGAGDDESWGVATSTAGDVYVSGLTTTGTSTLIASAGAHQTSYGGGRDAFLVKFNTSGVRQWGTYYGGSGEDRGYSVDVNTSGDAFLCGDAASTSSISTIGSHQVANAGNYDAMLVKFNSAGVRQWGTYCGGVNQEYEPVCKVDDFGDIYINGYTDSPGGIATPGTHASASLGGGNDAYLVKFNTSGVRQWGSYHGSSLGLDYVNKSFDTDPAGNIYFGGFVSSGSTNNISTAGSHQVTHGGGNEGYIVSFSPLGQKRWGTYYGGASSDVIYSVVYSNGSIYAAGQTGTGGGTVIASAGSHQSAYGGGTDDGFLVKFNPSRAAALDFDGSNDEVNCGVTVTNLLANTNKITVEAWANPTTTLNIGTVVGNHLYPANNMQFLIRKDYATWTFWIGNSAPGTWSVVNALNTVTVNKWQHIAGTWDGTVATIYVNGVLSGTASVTYTSMGATSNSVSIGYNSGVSPNEKFIGSIDEVRIWNRVLCLGEIQNNRNAEIQTTSPGLIANYHFNHGFAAESNVGETSLTDYSGSNATGTLTGFGLSGAVSNWVAPGGVTTDSFVTPYTTPTISVNSGSICAGNSFTINPNGASTYTFQGGNAVVSPTSNSTYSVIGTTSLGCITSSASSAVTVNTLPNVTASSATICVGETTTLTANGATSYSWNTGANTTSASVNPTTTTVYTVTGTSSVGCVNTGTSSVTVNLCTSLNQIGNTNNETRLYPNPSNGIFTMELSSSAKVKILDLLGRSVYSDNLEQGNYKMDLSPFENGVYFIQINQNNNFKTIKIIKE